jgi:4'-phosphopantetheinyl transferase EntD
MRLPDQDALARELEREFGGRWCVAVTHGRLDEDDLTHGELAGYRRLPATGPRRAAWLAGRLALRRVLERLGQAPDTAGLSFPSARLSLSHAGSTAVAVATDDLHAAGVGVDVEPARPSDQRIARFFLQPDEQAWLAGQAPAAREAHLTRLWTVKEAAYKANLRNAGTVLAQYRLADPQAWRGTALAPVRPTTHIRYRSLELDGGYITVAATKGDQSS